LKILLFFSIVSLIFFPQVSKKKVTFQTSDGLEVSADLYMAKEEYPYIILFHQAGSSRGEYNETATKLTKMRFNCLAVDLRVGDNSNYIRNETARKARKLNKPAKYIDAQYDMLAAIDYAYSLNHKNVVLFGSSYSASLSLVIGKDHPEVDAIIAFSPGEYFGDDLRMESEMDTIAKPVFIAVTENELPYVEQMIQNLPKDNVTLFQPSNSSGVHGSKALWDDSESKNEYWLALLLFINSIQ